MTIYIRECLESGPDLDIMPDGFFCQTMGDLVKESKKPKPSKVIGRYAVLPFYKEWYRNIKSLGLDPIHTPEGFQFVSELEKQWELLRTEIPMIPLLSHEDLVGKNRHQGPFVIKGEYKSRKGDWENMMYCDTPNKFRNVVDSLLQTEERVYIRPFVSLKGVKDLEGKLHEPFINGLPVSLEWRFHFIEQDEKMCILCDHFYWQDLLEFEHKVEYSDYDKMRELAHDTAKLLHIRSNREAKYFSVDVAILQDRNAPIVVEINAGELSGVCESHTRHYYDNLKGVLNDSSFKIKDSSFLNSSSFNPR